MPMTPALYHPRHDGRAAAPRRSTLRRVVEALAATLALLFGIGCSEQSAATSPILGDRAAPVVALHAATGGPDSTLAFTVDARDDLGLKTIQVRLSGGIARAFDTTFTSAVTNITVPLSYFVSRGVPVGTSVLAVATATDGALNTSKPDTLRLTVGNVTPPRVEVTGPAPGTLFVIGKSGVLSLSGRSKVKVRALGYTTSGPYKFADSVIFASPLRDSVAILDTLTLPDTVKAGVLVVTPFIIDSLGQRATGDVVSYAVQTVGTVSSVPVVTPGVSLRMELTDTIHVGATDPVGITRLGYEVRTLAGVLVTADSALLSGRLTVAETTFTSRLRVVPPTQITVRAFAVNAAGRRSYAKLPNSADRADTVLVVSGITRTLPNGGTVADGIYLPTWDRLYLTNIERNQLEVFSLPDTAFLAPIVVGSRPWGIAPWPRDRRGTMGDTLLVANSGGTNISYVDLRRGSTGREVYRYPLPNLIPCTITTQQSSAGFAFQQRTCYDFSDRPQYLAATCTAGSDNSTCVDAILLYSTTPTGGQSIPFAKQGTVRWENLISHQSHFFFEQAIGQGEKSSDTLEITRYAAGGIGSDSVLVPYRQWVYGLSGDSILASTTVKVQGLGFRDTTFVRNSGNFRRAIIGEGGAVNGSRAMRYDADVGMKWTYADMFGNTYAVSTPTEDLGISRYFDVSDFIANSFSKVLGVAINFDGELGAIRADSTYLIDPTLRLQGLLQTSGGSNAGFDFHPRNTGANSPVAGSRLAFSASSGPRIEVFDTYCYQKIGTIEVRDPIIGPIKTSARSNGGLVLVGASARGVIVVNLTQQFASACPAGVRAQ